MKNQILKKIYRAVVYLRLSDEDGDNRESDSISNQRILIHSFLKSHPEIQVVKECVDDGYTGTNFNRPGFQEMLRMLEEGIKYGRPAAFPPQSPLRFRNITDPRLLIH